MEKVWHVKTKEDYNQLVAVLIGNGYEFGDFTVGWEMFKEETCLSLDEEGYVTYCNVDFYTKQGDEIIEYSTEKVTKEDVIHHCDYCCEEVGLKITKSFVGTEVGIYKREGVWYLSRLDEDFFGLNEEPIEVHYCLKCGRKQ